MSTIFDVVDREEDNSIIISTVISRRFLIDPDGISFKNGQLVLNNCSFIKLEQKDLFLISETCRGITSILVPGGYIQFREIRNWCGIKCVEGINLLSDHCKYIGSDVHFNIKSNVQMVVSLQPELPAEINSRHIKFELNMEHFSSTVKCLDLSRTKIQATNVHVFGFKDMDFSGEEKSLKTIHIQCKKYANTLIDTLITPENLTSRNFFPPDIIRGENIKDLHAMTIYMYNGDWEYLLFMKNPSNGERAMCSNEVPYASGWMLGTNRDLEQKYGI